MLKEIREELYDIMAIAENTPEDSDEKQLNECLDDMTNAIFKLIWKIDSVSK